MAKAGQPVNKIKPRNEREGAVKGKFSRDFRIVSILTLIHLPLGVMLYSTGSIGVLHPYLVLGLGLFLAWRKQTNIAYVAFVVAYIVGAEVLWRMASVPVLWEFGKTASVVIMIVAIIRRSRFEIPKLPLLYIALLMPACLMTFADVDLTPAIDRMSLNMSGPVLLAVSCWFFYKARISPLQFRRLLIAFILPLSSVALAALFYTVTAEDLSFTSESNFATSGGFGPNQVSAMLGLGVFASAAGILLFKKQSAFSIYFGVLALGFAALCLMTFSRGGMYNALGGILVLLIFGLQDVAAGLRRVIPALVLGAFFMFFIYPMLDDFTGGALQDRFEDTGTTQRTDIAESDLQIFLENPVFGVGVGTAYAYRERFLQHKAISHTEFSRLISEHGTFGLAALAALIAMLVGNLKRQNSIPGKAFVAGVMAWSSFFMLNTGMRLAAPSFLWGLSFITIVSFRAHLAPIFKRVNMSPTVGIGGRTKPGLKPSKSF